MILCQISMIDKTINNIMQIFFIEKIYDFHLWEGIFEQKLNIN